MGLPAVYPSCPPPPPPPPLPLADRLECALLAAACLEKCTEERSGVARLVERLGAFNARIRFLPTSVLGGKFKSWHSDRSALCAAVRPRLLSARSGARRLVRTPGDNNGCALAAHGALSQKTAPGRGSAGHPWLSVSLRVHKSVMRFTLES